MNANSTIIIPVVVHVLHNGEPIGTGNNLSVAQIQSQIDVLNEDFRRLNADRTNTPAAFQGVATDPNFEFRLACVNPNGNSTNGIHRVQTTVSSFIIQFNPDNSINEQATGIKYTSTGGTNAWPTDKYLNIWVCNIAPFGGGQLLGYAQFPFDYSVSPNTDGVVIFNQAFGRVGSNLYFQYDRGRTTTHEIGHWLNLFHIWGDDNGVCSGSDQCGDTPNQGDKNFSCPSYPHISCTNGPNGDMFMNYMDYTVDACKNTYTLDQKNRARAVFATGGPRANFINNYFRLNNPTTDPVCTNASITAVNLMCLPITWSISGPATITPNGNLATITRNGSGVATVTATAGGYIDSKTINIGVPLAPVIGAAEWDHICGSYLDAICSHPLSATGYKWVYNGGFIQDGTSDTYSIAPMRTNTQVGQTYTNSLVVQARNACGLSASSATKYYTFGPVTANCGGAQLTVSPNPANNSLTVSTTDKRKFSSLKIVDRLGITRKLINLNAVEKTIVNVSDLQSGIYHIQAFINEQWASTTFIKE